MSNTQVAVKESEEIVHAVVHGMQEKKASEIVVLNLTKLPNAIADFFVICSGNSDTQIDAIKNSVEDVVEKQCHEKPWKSEGLGNKEWVLLDYVSVVTHIFLKNKRTFYGLEELWGDAEIKLIEEV